MTPKQQAAIERLDRLFSAAFPDANHPAMLDYIELKFLIREQEKEIEGLVEYLGGGFMSNPASEL